MSFVHECNKNNRKDTKCDEFASKPCAMEREDISDTLNYMI